MLEMQSNIGAFVTTFAPQLKSDMDILKTLLDILALAVGIGSASAWNIGRYFLWQRSLRGCLLTGKQLLKMPNFLRMTTIVVSLKMYLMVLFLLRWLLRKTISKRKFATSKWITVGLIYDIAIPAL